MKKPLDIMDLDNVTGGFAEKNMGLPTAGKKIVCPKCKSKNAKAFNKSVLFDPRIGSVEYQCKCGCRFVCYGDQVLLRKDWDDLCKKEHIDYKF